MGIFSKLFQKNEKEQAKENTKNTSKKTSLKPKNLKDETMDRFIKEAKTPVIVDCWADWCVPCKQLAPTIAELASEYEGKVAITKLNTEKNRKMSKKYGIRSIPTILYFKDGKLITRTSGALPKNAIKKIIEGKLLK